MKTEQGLTEVHPVQKSAELLHFSSAVSLSSQISCTFLFFHTSSFDKIRLSQDKIYVNLNPLS